MVDLITNLGQGFVDLLAELYEQLTDEMLISWLPTDIQLALGGLIVVMLIIAIKRAVFV